ncbi:MAG: tRNA pseudouridine(38-40) synthase TruA [Clostridia bacterium]|nr:tRNA pseudouridine(38-40) synthase TruA [Clostridia bacterium]
MEKNVLLTIAYDGSVFHGWQKQPGVRTVQGHLEQVMSRLFDREILLSGTSRTDAGVHANGQQASFKADLGIPIDRMAMVINNALCAAEDAGGYAKAPVRILKAEEMPEDFHARFNCKSKRYIYRISDGTGERDDADMSLVFERNYVYHMKEKLDVEAMNEAAEYLEGTHDFKSFEAAGGNPRETTIRTIFEAEVCRKAVGSNENGKAAGGEILFSVRGDGFLYNMVRIITGTLVEIGQGKRRPEEMIEIIEAADRTKAGHTAPPNGLYLDKVFY